MSDSPTESFRSRAIDKYKKLKSIYSADDVSFWMLGTGLDTVIDYFDTVDLSDAPTFGPLATTQFHNALAKLGIDNTWFDDFGWWCVSTQRALHRPYFNSDRGAFSDILDTCWSHFTNNAPYVWERRGTYKYNDYGPAVEGGVWNEYWAGTPGNFTGPKDGDPSSGTLHGIQNTVTNTVYLMAAQRLGLTDPVARQAADREREFLLTWLDAPQPSLWWEFSPSAGLVRERVSRFRQNKPAPGFQEYWAWAGDQGLQVGALSDAIPLVPEPRRKALLDRATHILTGVRDAVARPGWNPGRRRAACEGDDVIELRDCPPGVPPRATRSPPSGLQNHGKTRGHKPMAGRANPRKLSLPASVAGTRAPRRTSSRSLLRARVP